MDNTQIVVAVVIGIILFILIIIIIIIVATEDNVLPPLPPAPTNKFEVKPGNVIYAGNNLFKNPDYRDLSLKECEAECDSNDLCVGYTRNNSTGSCYIKSNAEGSINSEWTSGYKL